MAGGVEAEDVVTGGVRVPPGVERAGLGVGDPGLMLFTVGELRVWTS